MSSHSASAPPTYGNWVQPKSPGLAGLGLIPTAALMSGVVLTLLVSMLVSALAALVTAAVVLVPIALASVPIGAQTLGAAMTTRLGWILRKRRREDTYHSGVFASPLSGRPLPGVLAKTRMVATVDALNRQIAVLYRPGRHHYSVVLHCRPDGAGLVDPETVDVWVSHWGGFLAALGQEPGLRGASVVVDTAPDTGDWLASEHARTLSPTAPQLARDVLEEVIREFPQASADQSVYVCLTYAGADLYRKPGDTGAVVAELVRRLPG